MSNLNIFIPNKWYCGFKSNGSEVPLGFIIPDIDDDKGIKNRAKVDAWRSKSINAVSFDNTPVMGFKVARSITRGGWRSTTEILRVEDPRGFELEITVANFIMLMSNNMIDNGEIMAECVWAREGERIRLLAVNSEPYLEAMENTNRFSKKCVIEDIKLGQKVLMMDGSSGRYLGQYRGIDINGKLLSSKRHYFIFNKNALDSFTDPKISEVMDKSEISERDAALILENIFKSGSQMIGYTSIYGLAKNTKDIKGKFNYKLIEYNFSTDPDNLLTRYSRVDCYVKIGEDIYSNTISRLYTNTNFNKVDKFTNNNITFCGRSSSYQVNNYNEVIANSDGKEYILIIEWENSLTGNMVNVIIPNLR